MDVRVSLVVATKNRAQHVQQALPMWRSLKGVSDELIVVDGNSTDGTHDVLKAAHPETVDVVLHEPDRSESHAFNKGFLRARGHLIKILTDDDVYFPAELEKAYVVMNNHPEIDLLITGGEYVEVSQDGRESPPYSHLFYNNSAEFHVASTGQLPFICGTGFILRRSSLPLIGLLDPRHYLADLSLLMQAEKHGACIRYLRIKAFRHRLHAGSNGLSRKPRYSVQQMYRDLGCRLPTEWNRWRYLWRPWDIKQFVAWRLRNALDLPVKRPQAPEPRWDGALI